MGYIHNNAVCLGKQEWFWILGCPCFGQTGHLKWDQPCWPKLAFNCGIYPHVETHKQILQNIHHFLKGCSRSNNLVHWHTLCQNLVPHNPSLVCKEVQNPALWDKPKYKFVVYIFHGISTTWLHGWFISTTLFWVSSNIPLTAPRTPAAGDPQSTGTASDGGTLQIGHWQGGKRGFSPCFYGLGDLNNNIGWTKYLVFGCFKGCFWQISWDDFFNKNDEGLLKVCYPLVN